MGNKLPQLETITDLGIITNSSLNYNTHIDSNSNNAHSRSCIILRSFYSHNLTLLRLAFTTFVRPILEYDSHIWNPFTQQSTILNTLSRIPALKHLIQTSSPSKPRLVRRLRSDRILYYKIFNNLFCSNSGYHFSVFTSLSQNTRSSGARLVSSFGRTRILANNFFSRHINSWHSLPLEIKQTTSHYIFETKLNMLDLSPFFIGDFYYHTFLMNVCISFVHIFNYSHVLVRG